MTDYRPQSARGFVILFTILIASIILLIGFGIFSIATRETVLSSTSREAQTAFYAADAGVECALFAQGANILSGGGGTFDCGAIPAVVTGTGSSSLPYVFDVLVDAKLKTCAHVTIFDINAGAARRVVSQGYNICTDTGLPAQNNPILVERVLDTIYTLDGTPANPAVLSPSGISPGTIKVLDTGIQPSSSVLPQSGGSMPATLTPQFDASLGKPLSQ